ncbi:MAG: acylneuraminate cytidylyltransferase family protein [Clostridiaceae bacterium]|nr:acylneuraminate cytidylyltransferase family protein [Clostridiaceae bacterium]MBW4859678.1 acylneuraminate cytidylyltransferase family protein [Clostridiaceae bacterium]MBW4868799.1 acylneuraminate cytidylyltransferase family protein [Clostridiaceae bacterium]
MIDNKKVLAIIPARGGSKGIPRKNIADFCGKPLISWSIEEALKSKYIDRLIVSTEDEEIKEVSRKYGAEIPFLRPVELSQDDTPGIEPILHCINWLKSKEESEYDYICVLQCTSPFRKSQHIDEALEILIGNKGDSIVSVAESEVSPYWMKKIRNGKLVDFIKDIPMYNRRQDLPEVYKINGALYIIKTSILLKNKNWYNDNTFPYIMNRLDSIDIDEPIDFKIAEILMKERSNYYE